MPTNKDDLVIGVRLEANELTKELRKVRRSINRFNKRIDAAGKKAGTSFNKAARTVKAADKAVVLANKNTQKLGRTATAAGKKMDRALKRSTKNARLLKVAIVALVGAFAFKKILGGITGVTRGFGRMLRATVEQQRSIGRLRALAGALNATLSETQQYLRAGALISGLEITQIESATLDALERIGGEAQSDPESETGRAVRGLLLDLEALVGPGGIQDLADLRRVQDFIVNYLRTQPDRGFASYITRAALGDESSRFYQALAAIPAPVEQATRERIARGLTLPIAISPEEQASLNLAVENFDIAVANLGTTLSQSFIPLLDKFNEALSRPEMLEALDRLGAEVQVVVEDILEQLADPAVQSAFSNIAKFLSQFLTLLIRLAPDITDSLLITLAKLVGAQDIVEQVQGGRARRQLAGTQQQVETGLGRPLTRGESIQTAAEQLGFGFSDPITAFATLISVFSSSDEVSDALEGVTKETEQLDDAMRDSRVAVIALNRRLKREEQEAFTAFNRGVDIPINDRILDQLREQRNEINTLLGQFAEDLFGSDEQARENARQVFDGLNSLLAEVGEDLRFDTSNRVELIKDVSDFFQFLRTDLVRRDPETLELDLGLTPQVFELVQGLVSDFQKEANRLAGTFAVNFAQSVFAPFAPDAETMRDLRESFLTAKGVILDGLSPTDVVEAIRNLGTGTQKEFQALVDQRTRENVEFARRIGEDFFNVLGAFVPPEKVTGAQLQELTEDVLARLGIPSAEALRNASEETQKAAGRLFAAGVRRYEERNLRTGESRTDEELAEELEITRNRVTTEIAGGVQAGLLAGLENGTQGFLDFFRENLLNALTDQLAKSIAQGILEGIAESGANRFGDFIVNAVLGTSIQADDVNRLRPDRFHGGGVVPGRIGEEVPIIALAGETIRTRQQERQLRGDGGVNVYFQGANFDAAFQRNMEQNARTAFALQQAQASVVDYGE